MSTDVYTVARRIPDRHTKLRWCVIKDDRIIAHRNLRTDALEMARQLNELDPPPNVPQRASKRQKRGTLRRLQGDNLSTIGRLCRVWDAPVVSPQPGEIREKLGY